MPKAQPPSHGTFTTLLRTRSFWLLLFLFSYAFGLTLHEYSPLIARVLVWLVFIPFLIPVVRTGSWRFWPEAKYSIYALLAWFIAGFPLLFIYKGQDTWAAMLYLFSFFMIPGMFLLGTGITNLGISPGLFFHCEGFVCAGPATLLYWGIIIYIFVLVLTPRIKTLSPRALKTILIISLIMIIASMRGCALAV